jgi:hypothetical protein
VPQPVPKGFAKYVMQRMGFEDGPVARFGPQQGTRESEAMLIAIAVIILALAAVTIAWGRRIDAEVTGRIEAHRPPVRRPA